MTDRLPRARFAACLAGLALLALSGCGGDDAMPGAANPPSRLAAVQSLGSQLETATDPAVRGQLLELLSALAGDADPEVAGAARTLLARLGGDGWPGTPEPRPEPWPHPWDCGCGPVPAGAEPVARGFPCQVECDGDCGIGWGVVEPAGVVEPDPVEDAGEGDQVVGSDGTVTILPVPGPLWWPGPDCHPRRPPEGPEVQLMIPPWKGCGPCPCRPVRCWDGGDPGDPTEHAEPTDPPVTSGIVEPDGTVPVASE